jgi:hypothetical protein
MHPYDFPAAHSMDTYWFAVDRDGHVACFSTGEAGAVPEGSFAGDETYEAMGELRQLLPRTEVCYEREGRQMPGESTEGTHYFREGGRGYGGVVVFLRSLDPVREDLDAGRAREVPARGCVAVTFGEDFPAETARRLHEGGHCLGCFYHHEEDEDWPDMAARGLFVYDHLTDNWISGPYGRERSPVTPIHIDQLPPALRDPIKGMTFPDLRFADTSHIQPVDHASCFSWEGAYLDLTGKRIRPIPGMEELYTESYEQYLTDMADEYEIEPPGGAPTEEE